MITTEEYVISHLPKIDQMSDKYSRGHLFVIAGSYGMAGAAILCLRAAFSSGVGYVTAAMPEEIYPIITAAVPEAVCKPYESADLAGFIEIVDTVGKKCNAVVFGPGIGRLRDMLAPVVFERVTKPLLIDADGLNALAGMPAEDRRFASTDSVLTPHEGECARLLDTDRFRVHENRGEMVRKLSTVFSSAALLKGPKTLIFDVRTGRMMQNPTGCEALARAGSGDVLSGLTGGLMAQGVNGFDAAVVGAYLHGLSGDRCQEKIGSRGVMPSDVITELNEIFKELDR